MRRRSAGAREAGSRVRILGKLRMRGSGVEEAGLSRGARGRGQFQVRDTGRFWPLPGEPGSTWVRSEFMPTGFPLLSVGNHQGGIWQTRGHCPVEDRSVERRTALPEPGLEDGDVSSELLPGKERHRNGMPARASSIWGSRLKKKKKRSID